MRIRGIFFMEKKKKTIQCGYLAYLILLRLLITPSTKVLFFAFFSFCFYKKVFTASYAYMVIVNTDLPLSLSGHIYSADGKLIFFFFFFFFPQNRL